MTRRTWLWFVLPLLAVGIAVIVLRPQDDSLQTAFVDVPASQPTEATPVRVLSGEPFVVEWLGSPLPGASIGSPNVRGSLRSTISGLHFDDYVILRRATVQLPCDCGPDESPPIQPVVFDFEVSSREALSDTVAGNTSGAFVRCSVNGGILSVYRDGEVVFHTIEDGTARDFAGELGADDLADLVDSFDVERFAHDSKLVRWHGGTELLLDAYLYVPYSDSTGESPPDWLLPTLDSLGTLADWVMVNGEEVTTPR